MKTMKSYPLTVSANDMEALYRRILKDKSIVFIQAKTTANWTDARGEEYDNWTDWQHLKGGGADHIPTGNIYYDCFGSWHDYFTKHMAVGSNGYIHTLEWMRADKQLHVINIVC